MVKNIYINETFESNVYNFTKWATCKKTNFCWNILNVFLVHGYIQGIQKNNQTILIILKYIDGVPAIHELKQVSRSSQRVYKPWNRLNLYQQGLGLVLVSTSKGILPSAKAFEYKIGGEVLCQVF